MAEDGVHEVVGGIAAEGEEGGVGRILALRGMEGLGFISSAGLSLLNRNKLQANQYATCSICSLNLFYRQIVGKLCIGESF